MDSITSKEEIKEKTKKIYSVLPQKDDQKCGYRTCGQFARAVAEGQAPCDGCITGGSLVAEKVCAIMGIQVPTAASFDTSVQYDCIDGFGNRIRRRRRGR